ncbi:MAG TPA: nitroreductase [Ramlibacter sp.]
MAGRQVGPALRLCRCERRKRTTVKDRAARAPRLHHPLPGRMVFRRRPRSGETEGVGMEQVKDSSAATFDTLARTRTTVRAFLPDAVPRGVLSEILELAQRAPSTFNTQPWRVHVLSGQAKEGLTREILLAHEAAVLPPFSPFPPAVPRAQAAHQADFGRRYYEALGIDRGDTAARYRQTGRNFSFFGAPVGLIITTDRTLTKHSWLDCGIFLQTLMLAAHARGLATCPQVAFLRFESSIAARLELPDTEAVACGMSLGWPDTNAPVNRLDMPREAMETMARWHGFESAENAAPRA